MRKTREELELFQDRFLIVISCNGAKSGNRLKLFLEPNCKKEGSSD